MFKTAAVFSDNMVLQREKNISIWGEAADGAVISVLLNGEEANCIAKNGKWTVVLPPMAAGGPYELNITCTNVDNSVEKCTFSNVMIGEVWFCGGQSNMELEIHTSKNGEELLKTLTPDMPIRFYYTGKANTVEKAIEMEKNSCWSVCGEESSRAWSAVGFYFAQKLAKELGVTVGLIGCNWGGTSASAWVNRETLESDKSTNTYLETFLNNIEGKTLEQQILEYSEYEEYDRAWFEKSQEVYKEKPNVSWDEVCKICGENKWPGPINSVNPFRPAGLFETMVMRVCPYTMRGFLYYQGESDDHKPDVYYTLLTKLIGLWREKWEDDEMFFNIVQLPMFKYQADPDYKHWCKIREAQMKAFRTVKNTGIAVISDCGEFNEIHPTDKKPVGERLCLQAQKYVYGMDVKAFGPVYKSYRYKDGGIELYFDYADNGFIINGDEPKGFEIAGEDKVFYPANVKIDGNKIYINSDKVEKAVFARYNWFNYADVTIFNETGIPLAPFRTSMHDE